MPLVAHASLPQLFCVAPKVLPQACLQSHEPRRHLYGCSQLYWTALLNAHIVSQWSGPGILDRVGVAAGWQRAGMGTVWRWTTEAEARTKQAPVLQPWILCVNVFPYQVVGMISSERRLCWLFCQWNTLNAEMVSGTAGSVPQWWCLVCVQDPNNYEDTGGCIWMHWVSSIGQRRED